jgi:hypothetical protein
MAVERGKAMACLKKIINGVLSQEDGPPW